MGNKKAIVKSEPVKTVDTIKNVDEALILEYLDAFGIAKQLSDGEKKKFMNISLSFNLNPFKREIYCIVFKNKQGGKDNSIVVGYEVYLKRAERTGKLDGWGCVVEGTGANKKAVLTIYRKDWSHPFVHDVLFSEYDMHNKIWREKPHTMLKKVAISQGFRLVFPDELGGLPYTAEEQWAEEALVKSIEATNQIRKPEKAKAKILQLEPKKITKEPEPEKPKETEKVEIREQRNLLIKNIKDMLNQSIGEASVEHMKIILKDITAHDDFDGFDSFKPLNEDMANEANSNLFKIYGEPPEVNPEYLDKKLKEIKEV